MPSGTGTLGVEHVLCGWVRVYDLVFRDVQG